MKVNENVLFDEAIKQIQTQFGKGCVVSYDDTNEEIEVIPTGSIALDKALGIGGIPRGRIIEIYGNESSGKTTVALQMIAQCQKLNGRTAYIDLEHALDKKFCETNGIDTSKMLLSQPETGEQTFSIIEALIKTDMIDLIVVDSVAAMVPQAEIDGEFEDQTMGLHARIMSKGMRIIQNLIDKHKTTIVFINQLREKIGVVYGNNEITTGGRALRFYSSIRIELRRSELLKKGDDCVGIRTCAKVIKNKMAPPLTKAYVDIYFDKGFDHTSEIIDFALESSVIEKRGTWFYFENEKIGQGKDSTRSILLSNPDLFLKIKSKVLAKDGK